MTYKQAQRRIVKNDKSFYEKEDNLKTKTLNLLVLWQTLHLKQNLYNVLTMNSILHP